MTGDQDLVQRYLDELALQLHGSAAQIRRVLAETEAHLQDAIEDETSSGTDPQLAPAAAVARFGSPEQVAAAANRVAWSRMRGPIARATATLLTRLAATGLLALGLTGALARLIAALSSSAAVYGLPATAAPSAASCRHWLALHPATPGCRAAATLEASGDLTLTFGIAGALGALLLLALARYRRTRPVAVLPPVLGPALGATISASAAGGAAVLAVSDAVVLSTWGAGLYWSAAAVCACWAVGEVVLLIRALPASCTGVPTLGIDDPAAVG